MNRFSAYLLAVASVLIPPSAVGELPDVEPPVLPPPNNPVRTNSVCLPAANCLNLLETENTGGGAGIVCALLKCSGGSVNFRACVPVEESDRPCVRQVPLPGGPGGNGVVATCTDCKVYKCSLRAGKCDCGDARGRAQENEEPDGEKDAVEITKTC